MPDEALKPSPDGGHVGGGLSDDANESIIAFRIDPVTKRLKVDAAIDAFTGVTDGEAVDNATTGTLILGTDGTNYQVVSTNSSGRLQVDIVSGGGGGTQYTEDDAAAVNPIGNMNLARRRDSLSSEVSADGDNVAINATGKGELYVKHVDSLAVTGTFFQATQPVSLASVPSHAVTNAGTFAVQDAILEAAIHNEDVASGAADPLISIGVIRRDTPVVNANVSADGDYTNIIVDNLGKLWTADNQVEDAASASGDHGSFVLGVRNDAQSTLTSTDGDYGAFAIDGAGNLMSVGNIAHGTADAKNPVKVGFYATNANRTRVSNAQRTDGIADLAGRQITNLGAVRELRAKQTTTISASTSETTIVTAAASIFNDLAALIISNTSATATRLDVRDTTAGTILFSLYIPAGDVRGFSLPGFSLPQTTVNTNWTAQSSVSVTDLRVLAIYEKNI